MESFCADVRIAQWLREGEERRGEESRGMQGNTRKHAYAHIHTFTHAPFSHVLPI